MARKKFVKVAIDQRKLVRDLKKAMGEVVDKTMKFSTPEKLTVGWAVIDEMLTAIEKGISPIKGEGRFPAYKWAGAFRAAKKSASSQLRNSRAYKDLRGKKKSAFKRELETANLKKFENKYPFSVKKKFPSKRERPVNLTLSGDFLTNLLPRVTGRGQFEVGFFDRLSALKEMGHREGVNDQPKRPVVPGKGEVFSESVYRRLLYSLVDLINRRKIGGSKTSRFAARVGKLFR